MEDPKTQGLPHGPFPLPEYRHRHDPRPRTIEEIMWEKSDGDPELYQLRMLSHVATLEFLNGTIAKAVYNRDIMPINNAIQRKINLKHVTELAASERRRRRSEH